MNPKKSKRQLQIIVTLDMLMIFIFFINISWSIFDWFFTIENINLYFSEKLSIIHKIYLPIHEKFFYYELIFVGIYITEIILQWIVAIRKKTYYKWFLYPIIHWYDVLGSIPAGSWIVLRFLRIIAIAYRFHKLKIIDIKKSFLYTKSKRYYDIVVEEISDRVVINVLNGVQDEINTGTNISERIINEIIFPKKELITNIIADKIRIISKGFFNIHKKELKTYVKQNVDIVFERNKDAKIIKKIPVLGSSIENVLKNSIQNIIYQIIENIITDITTKNNKQKITEISNTIFESFIKDFHKDIDHILDDIVIDAIEIIKDQVKIQQWKIKQNETQKP